jgi:hypothetical protein
VAHYRVVSLQQRPELVTPALALLAAGWPEFMQHDQTAQRCQSRLAEDFAAYQVVLMGPKHEPVAVGVSIPFAWDGTLEGLPAGWDAVVQQGIQDRERGRQPTALSALSITVAPDRLGQGLSPLVIKALRRLAADAGLDALLGPVRPTRKSAYPLVPMERYVGWTRPDGAPFDPWLRTHWRLGGRQLKVCVASMVIVGDVASWEAWTQLRFPQTGRYVVPGALVPVQVDRERDVGRYVEPNVWVQHAVWPR